MGVELLFPNLPASEGRPAFQAYKQREFSEKTPTVPIVTEMAMCKGAEYALTPKQEKYMKKLNIT